MRHRNNKGQSHQNDHDIFCWNKVNEKLDKIRSKKKHCEYIFINKS